MHLFHHLVSDHAHIGLADCVQEGEMLVPEFGLQDYEEQRQLIARRNALGTTLSTQWEKSRNH